MKRIIFCITVGLVFLMASTCLAERRHTFYDRYDPSSDDWVYDDTGATTTGDVADVFTFDKKTIFISFEDFNSTEISYKIEGRCVGELDTWSILDTGEMGTASADSSKNVAIDITELVDYLRVGLRVTGNDADKINVRGIFRRGN